MELPDIVNTSICIQQLPPLPGTPEPPAGRMTVAVRYAAVGDADPVDPMPAHEDHALLRELTPEAAEAILTAAGPGSHSPQTIVELRLLGGELAREPRHRSAFCHRNAAYSLSVIGVLVPPVAEAVAGRAAALVAGARRGRREVICRTSRRRRIRTAPGGATTGTHCTGCGPWAAATIRRP